MKESAQQTNEIEARLLSTMGERFGVSLAPSVNLSDLGIDSVAMADLIADLENEFDVRFDQDMFEVETISGLAVYISARRSADH